MFVAFVPLVYFRRKSEQKLTKAIRNQSVLGRKPNPFVAFVAFCFWSLAKRSAIQKSHVASLLSATGVTNYKREIYGF